MPATFWTQALFPHIQAGATVLTPNRRLSATIHKHYQVFCLQQKKSCWLTPEILPIITWIQKQWQQYTRSQFTPFPLLLNPLQEQFLWEKVLTDAKENNFLLRTDETADIARSAWSLLNQWQVSIEDNAFQDTEEGVALRTWIKAFQHLCHDKKVMDMNKITEFLITHIASNHVQLPLHIIFVGFNELSPQLNTLIATCRQRGSHITVLTLQTSKNLCQKIVLKDQETEILTMARWAKKHWQQYPTATIGCVVPTLDKVRDRVMQIFSEVFNSESMPFNISAGKPLTQYPIIKAALKLLSFYKHQMNCDIFSYVLASPFLGDADTERINRANFDTYLRKKNINRIQFSEMQQIFEQYIPRFSKRINDFQSSFREQPFKQSFSQWALVIHQLLTILGWPGERSLNSEEYQTVENWLKLLSEIKTLDHVTDTLSFSQILHVLQKMATKRIFQSKTEDSPIQVLGTLEAAALPFDYLWVSGMDDMAWPPQPNPNPLIPKRLQRELGMPHATADRELHYCEALTEQFRQSSNHVIFSHATTKEDLTLQSSPLLHAVDEIIYTDLQLPDDTRHSERIFSIRAIETLIDDYGPAIASHEAVRGGVNILKQQALCPFKAFVECRLFARELEFQTPGLRAKDRGTVLHKALEIFWGQLQTQASLNKLSEAALSTSIEDAVDRAIADSLPAHRQQTTYLRLEKQRLFRLISDWLALERTRLPFKIATNEGMIDIHLNTLTLSLRIDRIDELDDGRKLIIDYKTGRYNDVNNWFGDRLEEPQLPLYALIDTKTVVGIAIAQLAAGDQGFKGICREDINIKGIRTLTELKKAALSWDEQIENWSLTLNHLCDDFAKGVAKVDPKDATQTCLRCALKGVCRIHEEVKEYVNPSH